MISKQELIEKYNKVYQFNFYSNKQIQHYDYDECRFTDFRLNDDSFHIVGYCECSFSCDYDKYYCLIDYEGRNFTEVTDFGSCYTNSILEETFVICGNCADKYGLKCVKRECHRYEINNDAIFISPPITEIGKKIIKDLDEYLSSKLSPKKSENELDEK